MTAALAIQLILALIGDFPEIEADIKAFFAAKAPSAPVSPQIAADTQSADAALNTPVK